MYWNDTEKSYYRLKLVDELLRYGGNKGQEAVKASKASKAPFLHQEVNSIRGSSVKVFIKELYSIRVVFV